MTGSGGWRGRRATYLESLPPLRSPPCRSSSVVGRCVDGGRGVRRVAGRVQQRSRDAVGHTSTVARSPVQVSETGSTHGLVVSCTDDAARRRRSHPNPPACAGSTTPTRSAREWAVYSGTLQAIGVAGAFGAGGKCRDRRPGSGGRGVRHARRSTESARDGRPSWSRSATRCSTTCSVRSVAGRRRRSPRSATAGATDDHIGAARHGGWDAALRARDPRAAGDRGTGSCRPTSADDRRLAAAAAFDAAVTPFEDDPSLQVDGGARAAHQRLPRGTLPRPRDERGRRRRLMDAV